MLPTANWSSNATANKNWLSTDKNSGVIVLYSLLIKVESKPQIGNK